jgi:hypothetical protein
MFKFAALAVTPLVALSAAEDAIAEAPASYGGDKSDYGYKASSGYDSYSDAKGYNSGYSNDGYSNDNYKPSDGYGGHGHDNYKPSGGYGGGKDSYSNDYQPDYKPTYKEPEYKPTYKEPEYAPTPASSSAYSYDDYYSTPEYKTYAHEPFTPPEDPYKAYEEPKCTDKSLPNSAEWLTKLCMNTLYPSMAEWVNSRCGAYTAYGSYPGAKESYENSQCEYYSTKAMHHALTACVAAADLRTKFVNEYAKDGKGKWKCEEQKFRQQSEKCYSKSMKYYPFNPETNYIEEHFNTMIGSETYVADYSAIKLEGAVLAMCSYNNGDRVIGKGGEYGGYY